MTANKHLTNTELFIDAWDRLRIATTQERNTKKALTGNLPKHKLRRYRAVVAQAYVVKLNAQEKYQAAYKRLSNAEKQALSSR